MALLLVGLGNPGPQYRTHRHNVGFMVLERIHAEHSGSEWRDKYSSKVSRAVIAGRDATLIEPQTFMNLSGRAVQKAMTDLRARPADIIVVHDDLDLAFGTSRLKVGGGHGGHNGLRDIIATLGPDFVRLRVGIGRPATDAVEDYVLSPFDPVEKAGLDEVIAKACEALVRCVAEGPEQAMNSANVRARKSGGR